MDHIATSMSNKAIIPDDVERVCKMLRKEDVAANPDLDEAIEQAIEHGNSSSLQALMNQLGGRYTPSTNCHIATSARKGHFGVIRVLLKRMIACNRRVLPSMIKLFIDGKSTPLNMRDSTAIDTDRKGMSQDERDRRHQALAYLREGMTQEERDECDSVVKEAKLNIRHADGETKLTRAVKMHDLKMIDDLISKGVNIHLCAIDGISPIALADNIEVAMRLLAAGANPYGR